MITKIADHRWATISLGPPLPTGSSNLPGPASPGQGVTPVSLLKQVSGGRGPAWSCTRWGLPCLDCRQPSGALLPHLFTLTGPEVGVQTQRAMKRKGQSCVARSRPSLAPPEGDSLRTGVMVQLPLTSDFSPLTSDLCLRTSSPAVCFLWHFPALPRRRRSGWALPTTVPCRVRTFLVQLVAARGRLLTPQFRL